MTVSEITSNKNNGEIGDEEREIYMIVVHDTINLTIALFGIVANIMNITVFFKQGFNNTINISFFGLAISDLCSVTAMLWFSICVNPLFVNSDVPMYPLEILHLTAGIPHICFVRITGWITVFITVERCLCITIPLKIKQIITPKVTMITIFLIYLGVILSFVPEYQTSYIGWKFYPDRNKTLLGLEFTNDGEHVKGLSFFLYSILGKASFITVIIFTVILVVQLKRKSEWRRKANVDKARSETISNRDRKTMNMVVSIAIILIVTSIPGVTISMTLFFEPEFSILGREVNAFLVAWSFAIIFQCLNSSINIFLYYNMSTKYRETFHRVFGFCGNVDTLGRQNTVNIVTQN